MVEYTCDVVKATLHRVLPILQAHLPLLPTSIWTLWTARLPDSFLCTNFPGLLFHSRLLHPALDLLSSPLGHRLGAISSSKTCLFPASASLSAPMTSCLSIFPVICLCQNCPYAPPHLVSLTGPVITHMDPQAQTWHSDRISLYLASTIWALLAFKNFFAFIAKMKYPEISHKNPDFCFSWQFEIQQHGCTSLSPCDKGPLWIEHGFSISPQSPTEPCYFSPEASYQNHLS